MQDGLLHGLRLLRPQTRERWATLLRAERATTPLANPEALVHLIDWTLDEMFSELAALSSRRQAGVRVTETAHRADDCCGRNPFLVYFAAGEQAMREALILRQAAMGSVVANERDEALADLNHVLHHLARRELEAFCGVCQFRPTRPESTAPAAAPVEHFG